MRAAASRRRHEVRHRNEVVPVRSRVQGRSASIPLNLFVRSSVSQSVSQSVCHTYARPNYQADLDPIWHIGASAKVTINYGKKIKKY